MKKELEQKIAQTVYNALSSVATKEEEAHILLSLTKTLEEKHMLDRGDRIVYALKDLFDSEKGIVKAHITVRQRLSVEDKKQLEEILKLKYNASNVVLIEKVDERILGGIRIKIGEEVFDATVKNRLKELSKTLQK